MGHEFENIKGDTRTGIPGLGHGFWDTEFGTWSLGHGIRDMESRTEKGARGRYREWNTEPGTEKGTRGRGYRVWYSGL